jgi:acetate kinase
LGERRVLTLNGGSSSLKYATFAGQSRTSGGAVERIARGGPRDHAAALEDVLGRVALGDVEAVGHRLVHGGARERPERVTDALLADLRPLAALDPDHLPAELAIIAAVSARLPGVPQVACFDTAFHATMPRVARLLPLPWRFEAQGVRRYGFHGLSYTYLLEALARNDGHAAANGRVILAHLGSGASLAACRDGRCVDTTMGFTPTSGVPMGTRSGDVEPGVLLHLLRQGMSASELDAMLNHASGLLGVSGTSADMRDLLAAEASDPRAADAVALFVWQVTKAAGGLATTIGGLETLVFAGGIGEHAAPIRDRIAAGLAHLGSFAVRVIPTDEESILARETVRIAFGG